MQLEVPINNCFKVSGKCEDVSQGRRPLTASCAAKTYVPVLTGASKNLCDVILVVEREGNFFAKPLHHPHTRSVFRALFISAFHPLCCIYDSQALRYKTTSKQAPRLIYVSRVVHIAVSEHGRADWRELSRFRR